MTRLALRGGTMRGIGLMFWLATGTRALGAQSLTAGRWDVVAQAQQVTGGLGDWRGVTSRLVLRPSVRDTWYAEGLWQRAFHDDGVYASVGERHALGTRWTTYLSLGSGTGEFVLPDLRADAQLGFTWGPGHRLVTTLGTTVVDAKRGYSDVAGLVSVAAYLAPSAVAEVGERITRSSPGGVQSARTNAALTLGREGRGFLVLRGSLGGEGYQLIGPAIAIRTFNSQEGAVNWRQWLGHRGGFVLQAERYANDLYTRSGVSVGGFVDW